MNGDLISRSALLEDIDFDREAAKVHPQEICERFNRFCDYAEELVNDAPAVDAEPVRHEKWRKHGYADIWRCTKCGKYASYPENFCPNCGAKMDGDGNAID